MQWTGTILTFIEEGYVRMIPAIFGQNPASSLGEMFFEVIHDDA